MVSFLILFTNGTKNIYHSEKVKLTDKLEIPTPVGDGQHGTSWWLQKKNYEKVFKCNEINRSQEYGSVCLASAGIITNFEKTNDIEKVYFIDDNLHTLLIGSSGSRKEQVNFNSKHNNVRIGSERIYLLVMLKGNYIYIQQKN